MAGERGDPDDPERPVNYTLFDPPAAAAGSERLTPPAAPSGKPAVAASSRKPSERDLLTFQALASVKGMGRASLAMLYDTFRPLSTIWEAAPDDLRDVLKLAKNLQADAVTHRVWIEPSALMDRAGDLLRQFEREDIRIVFRDDPSYPRPLRDLEDAPRWLYVMGAFDLLHRTSSVAVVGTREPTQAGRLAARRAGHVLTDIGFVVISGLAEGIDQEVHTAVLQRGGETVAVLGNGFGVEFPAGSGTLRRQIVEKGGAVVTEYLPSESYSRRTFIDRNRIQAALSSAVIPVQGARKSGTAHTVRFAQELGRPLIGVWSTRPVPAPENEMLDWLVELGATIHNLSNPEGAAAFVAELAPFATDARPAKRDPLAERRRAYGTAIKLLQSVLAERPPTEEDARWLVEGIQGLVRQAVRPAPTGGEDEAARESTMPVSTPASEIQEEGA